jgi:predicted small metal-binding protein
MTHELDCVIDGCDASISEDSEAEVLEAAEEHATEAHPDLELDDETVEVIRENIEEV